MIMNTYHINKGIGRTVEFKGLKAQYLFIFAGGLLGILVCVMVMYMAGVNTYLCLIGFDQLRQDFGFRLSYLTNVHC